MPTDSASILPLIERINSISRQCYKNVRFADMGKQQQQLVRATEQLLIAVESPTRISIIQPPR